MNDTELIQSLDALAVEEGKPLILEGRIYRVENLNLHASKILGAGWNRTIIEGENGDVITLSDGFQVIQDLKITSSIPSNLRDGAGIKIEGSTNVHLSRIFCEGHKYGFQNTGAGNEFEFCFSVFNSSHGFFLDGHSLNHNEIGIYNCQSNNNVGDGFHIEGSGAGIFMTRPTSVGNANGILASGSVSDIFIAMPEISSNTYRGIDLSNNQGCALNVQGGLIEMSGSENVWIGADFYNTSIMGTTINGSASPAGGVVIAGQMVSIIGCPMDGNKFCAIRIGAGSKIVAITGCVGRNDGGQQTYGVFFDAGSFPATLSTLDFTDSPFVVGGAIPAGTLFRGLRGVSDR